MCLYLKLILKLMIILIRFCMMVTHLHMIGCLKKRVKNYFPKSWSWNYSRKQKWGRMGENSSPEHPLLPRLQGSLDSSATRQKRHTWFWSKRRQEVEGTYDWICTGEGPRETPGNQRSDSYTNTRGPSLQPCLPADVKEMRKQKGQQGLFWLSGNIYLREADRTIRDQK